MKKAARVALSMVLLVACLMPTPSGPAVATALSSPNDVFAILPETFTFASGAGGWWTDVHIHADGTFSGYYMDNDMGDDGDGYPNGTRYECRFSGSFADVARVDGFEYSMRVAALTTEGTKGETKIVDGRRVITAAPYGFDNAGEFRIYLPGKDTESLPEGYVSWTYSAIVSGRADHSMPPTLPFFGLYNVGGEMGFSSDPVAAASPAAAVEAHQNAADPAVSSSHIVGTITVTASGTVAVRTRGSDTGNPLVRINAGETYPCVGQDASGWYKVYCADYIGYVPNGAVAFSPEGAQASHAEQRLGIVEITSNDFANIRATSGQEGEWLAGVSPGIRLDCIDIAENGWYCVVLPSGRTGYVSGKLCSLQ